MAGLRATKLQPLAEDETLDDDRLPSNLKRQHAQTLLDFKAITVGEKIGRGAFSEVFRGKFGGQDVAIKKMKVPEKEAFKYLETELAILKSFEHPHLLKYYGAAFHASAVYIVTEFMHGGTLSRILTECEVDLPWPFRCRLARDVLDGIVTLHEKDIIHRDIKTDNILVDDSWRCAVSDYGFARKTRTDVAMTICGTNEFMAPEVIFGEVYNESADVFSFGVVLWELIYRKSPGVHGFMERGPRTKFNLDLDELRASAPADAPPSLLALACQCCEYEPDVRISSYDALDWLVSLTDELEAAAGGLHLPPAPSTLPTRRKATGAGAPGVGAAEVVHSGAGE